MHPHPRSRTVTVLVQMDDLILFTIKDHESKIICTNTVLTDGAQQRVCDYYRSNYPALSAPTEVAIQLQALDTEITCTLLVIQGTIANRGFLKRFRHESVCENTFQSTVQVVKPAAAAATPMTAGRSHAAETAGDMEASATATATKPAATVLPSPDTATPAAASSFGGFGKYVSIRQALSQNRANTYNSSGDSLLGTVWPFEIVAAIKTADGQPMPLYMPGPQFKATNPLLYRVVMEMFP